MVSISFMFACLSVGSLNAVGEQLASFISRAMKMLKQRSSSSGSRIIGKFSRLGLRHSNAFELFATSQMLKGFLLAVKFSSLCSCFTQQIVPVVTTNFCFFFLSLFYFTIISVNILKYSNHKFIYF